MPLRRPESSFEVRRRGTDFRSLRARSTDIAQLNSSEPQPPGPNDKNDIPQRPASAFARVRSTLLSAFRIPGNIQSPSPNKSREQTSKDDEDRDYLPIDRIGLEARLNYHVAQLERLRDIVWALNRFIEYQNMTVGALLARPNAPFLTVSSKKQDQTVEVTRKNRNKYGPFVGYHRTEIKRIVDRMLALQAERNEDLRIPALVNNLPTSSDWNDCFSI